MQMWIMGLIRHLNTKPVNVDVQPILKSSDDANLTCILEVQLFCIQRFGTDKSIINITHF